MMNPLARVRSGLKSMALRLALRAAGAAWGSPTEQVQMALSRLFASSVSDRYPATPDDLAANTSWLFAANRQIAGRAVRIEPTMTMVTRTPTGKSRETPVWEHPFLRLLQQPNLDQTGKMFHWQQVVMLNSAGRVYVLAEPETVRLDENPITEMLFGPGGGPKLVTRIARLSLLEPDRTKVVPASRSRYAAAYDYHPMIGAREVFPAAPASPAEREAWKRDPKPFVARAILPAADNWNGQAVSRASQWAIKTLYGLNQMWGNQLQNGLHAGLVFYLQHADMDHIERWEKAVALVKAGVGNAGQPLVLPKGQIEVANSPINMEDMQYKDLAELARHELLAAAGASDGLLGISQQMSRANVDAMERIMALGSIDPLNDLIADMYNGWFLPLYPGQSEQSRYKIVYKSVAVSDDVTETQRLVAASGGPVITPNEAREQINMDKLPGEDVLRASAGLAADTQKASNFATMMGPKSLFDQGKMSGGSGGGSSSDKQSEGGSTGGKDGNTGVQGAGSAGKQVNPQQPADGGKSGTHADQRFNPNHDEHTGEFTYGDGGGEGAQASKLAEIKSEWAKTNNKLLSYMDRPDDPEAKALADKMKGLVKESYGMAPDATGLGIGNKNGPLDMVVVGAGPAGLAAGIMGGTDGLRTLILDGQIRVGGQAKYSSRIENFPGFPIGVTGEHLAQSMLEQSERLGAEVAAGVRVTGMSYDPATGVKTLTLSNGQSVQARSVVIAAGLEFRHLNVPGADAQGVVYADPRALKAATLGGSAVVYGGSNGAAQAALGVCQTCKGVTLISRSPISKEMSDYQVQALHNNPKVTVIEGDEIAKVNTDAKNQMTGVTLKSGKSVEGSGLGVFIGSVPNLSWLPKEVATEGGRISVNNDRETTMPGVFAAGDIRAGSIPRVGAAVGDGQFAERGVFQYFSRVAKSGEKKDEKTHLWRVRAAESSPKEEWDNLVDRAFDLDEEDPFFGQTVEDAPSDGNGDDGEQDRSRYNPNHDPKTGQFTSADSMVNATHPKTPPHPAANPSAGLAAGAKVSAADRAVLASHAIAAEKLLKANGGFSLTSALTPTDSKGYYVSLAGHEQQVPMSDFSANAIMAYHDRFAEQLGRDHSLVLGGWHNPDDGKVYLDVSKAFPSKDAAIEFGKRNGQLAGYDAFTGESFPIVSKAEHDKVNVHADLLGDGGAYQRAAAKMKAMLGNMVHGVPLGATGREAEHAVYIPDTSTARTAGIYTVRRTHAMARLQHDEEARHEKWRALRETRRKAEGRLRRGLAKVFKRWGDAMGAAVEATGPQIAQSRALFPVFVREDATDRTFWEGELAATYTAWATQYAQEVAERVLSDFAEGSVSDLDTLIDQTVAEVQSFIRERAPEMAAEIAGTTLDQVAEAVTDALAEGLARDEIVRVVKEQFPRADDPRSKTIAQTETSYTTGQTTYQGGMSVQRQSTGAVGDESSGVMAPTETVGQMWLSMRDNKVRDAHAEADGQVVPLGELFDVGGCQMRYPGDFDMCDDLSNLINCRCEAVLVPVTGGEDGGDGGAPLDEGDGGDEPRADRVKKKSKRGIGSRFDWSKSNVHITPGRGRYNENHDPKTGQFTSGDGGGASDSAKPLGATAPTIPAPPEKVGIDAIKAWAADPKVQQQAKLLGTTDAVDVYTGAAYETINTALRLGHLPNGEQPEVLDKAAAVRLLNAIESAPSLKEPMALYRGIGLKTLGLDPAHMTGTTIQDGGFVSTTARPVIATQWAVGRRTAAVLDITVPTGTHVLPVDYAKVSASPGEAEVILPPGGRFEIGEGKKQVIMYPGLPSKELWHYKAKYIPPTRARFNPNHDPKTGEFAEGDGGGKGPAPAVPAALTGTLAGSLLHPEEYAAHAAAITQTLDQAHADDPTWRQNVAAVQAAMVNFPMIHTAQLGNIEDIEKKGLLPAHEFKAGLQFDKISGLDRTVFMRLGQAGGGGHGAVGVMIDPSKLNESLFLVTKLGLMTVKQDEDPYLRTPGDHRPEVAALLKPYMDSTVAFRDLPSITARLLVNGYEKDHPEARGTVLSPEQVVANDHGEMEVKYAGNVPPKAIIAYFAGDKPLKEFGDKTAYEYLQGKVPAEKLVAYHGESLPELSHAYRAYYAADRAGRARFNPNHDPKTGEFSEGDGGSSGAGKIPLDGTYQRPTPIKVSDLSQAVQLVLQGKVVELPDTKAAYTLTTKLAEIAAQMTALGKDAPNYDLCNVEVAGTNLFCGSSVATAEFPHGIPRLNMPQLAGKPLAGSIADKTFPHIPVKPDEVDGAKAFIHTLGKMGVGVTDETVPAARLRASQVELVGQKVAAMALNTKFDPGNEPLFISRDNYVIDGHHRWAALVERDAADGKLGDVMVRVHRIDAPITEVLHIAREWAHRVGLQEAAGLTKPRADCGCTA